MPITVRCFRLISTMAALICPSADGIEMLPFDRSSFEWSEGKVFFFWSIFSGFDHKKNGNVKLSLKDINFQF